MRTLVFLVVCLFAVPAFAQQVRTVQVPENMLTAEQKAQIEADNLKSKVQQYGSRVGFGAELGHAVDSSLGALTERADQFSKTGVGKFTLVLVAWKVIGKDFARIVIGLGLLCVLISILVWSYWKNCITRSVLIKVASDKTREYKVINIDGHNELKFAHAIFLGIAVVFSCLLMFG